MKIAASGTLGIISTILYIIGISLSFVLWWKFFSPVIAAPAMIAVGITLVFAGFIFVGMAMAKFKEDPATRRQRYYTRAVAAILFAAIMPFAAIDPIIPSFSATILYFILYFVSFLFP